MDDVTGFFHELRFDSEIVGFGHARQPGGQLLMVGVISKMRGFAMAASLPLYGRLLLKSYMAIIEDNLNTVDHVFKSPRNPTMECGIATDQTRCTI
jgi:hypothetical protein